MYLVYDTQRILGGKKHSLSGLASDPIFFSMLLNKHWSGLVREDIGLYLSIYISVDQNAHSTPASTDGLSDYSNIGAF